MKHLRTVHDVMTHVVVPVDASHPLLPPGVSLRPDADIARERTFR
ncbi:hypothetical protein [Streptomyces amritsarensis]